MDRSLEKLKEVSDLIDEMRKKKATQSGQNEPIDEIKQQRSRKDSLESQMAELDLREKEMKLRLKILKKKEDMVKLEQKLEAESIENRYYTEKPDTKGFIELREQKWEQEFQELISNLQRIEEEQYNGNIDDNEANEAKVNITKQINKLVKIKKQTISKNRMTKLKRGMNKVLKGVSTVSNEVSKISSELGQLGNMSGYDTKSSGNSTDWANFFNDKPSRSTKSTKKSKKRKSPKSKATRSSSSMFDGF